MRIHGLPLWQSMILGQNKQQEIIHGKQSRNFWGMAT
jgi:hypothetical protein